MPGAAATSVDAEYAQWLERVRATFEAVTYTCAHRLADPSLAEQVGVQVVAGLVARPAVFRYFGLPYSGRIARLAEARLAEADAGDLARVCAWAELRERLAAVPAEHREVLVVTCVRGQDLAGLAAELACDETAAQVRSASMLAFMHALAAPGLAAAPDTEG